MRELSVYYCPKCGRYAYYQLSRNAVCPKCDLTMTLLPLTYQEFMDLDCEQRDRLISKSILNASPSYVKRITAPEKMHNQRAIIGELVQQLTELEQDNQKLNETIEWMHKTIWDQLKRLKALERELNELKEVKHGKE